jgi:hypothetical protein
MWFLVGLDKPAPIIRVLNIHPVSIQSHSDELGYALGGAARFVQVLITRPVQLAF